MCQYLVCPFYNFEIGSFLKCFDFGTFNLKQYSFFKINIFIIALLIQILQVGKLRVMINAVLVISGTGGRLMLSR